MSKSKTRNSEQKRLQVYCSINDFAPLFYDLEYIFSRLKEVGIDGVEMLVGVKSRWSPKKIINLSHKYDLPVASIHQPFWSVLGIFEDIGFVDFAASIGVKNIVFHPLPRISFSSFKMRSYLEKISMLQAERGMCFMLENMPFSYNIPALKHFFPLSNETADIEKIFDITKAYNLSMALDTDHLRIRRPHLEQWYSKIFPRIRNIHLSSFAEGKKHLPLHLGDFDSHSFVDDLCMRGYSGNITLEISYPRLIQPFSLDFESIRKSVKIIRDSYSGG